MGTCRAGRDPIRRGFGWAKDVESLFWAKDGVPELIPKLCPLPAGGGHSYSGLGRIH